MEYRYTICTEYDKVVCKYRSETKWEDVLFNVRLHSLIKDVIYVHRQAYPFKDNEKEVLLNIGKCRV